MQETWTFNFSKSQQNESGLIDLLQTQEKELGIFLSYYYKKEGAVAENVRLKGKPEFESKLKGNFTLEFELVHFNACLAIHEQQKEEMIISFVFDPSLEKLILTGAYWPSREMDEI